MKNKNAEKEWQELLEENLKRTEDRTKELKEKGVSFHLDGENYYKDIEEWFRNETLKIKKKYGIV